MFLCKENNQIVSKIFVPIDRKIGKREHHIEISFKSQCSVQIWSYWAESNCRPTGYESVALPTELQ